MSRFRQLLSGRITLVALCLAVWTVLPVSANEKGGMPDLCQIEQTCLPTSTANLIIWFSKHGYPKLLLAGDNEDERELHTVHRIMADTDARFDWGTRQDKVTEGIVKYIHDAGYTCDVEYRGMDYGGADEKPSPRFTQDWLKDNDAPNKGFILLLAYCRYDRDSNTFTNAWDAGHAVTLVNAEPNMILIHDPAHLEDETGRKILTPQVLTSGMWAFKNSSAPVSGLLLLSGSLLEAPPDSAVMLTGAVCITMHPATEEGTKIASQNSGPNSNIGSGGSAAPSSEPSSPSAPTSTSTGWAMWLFDLLFKK